MIKSAHSNSKWKEFRSDVLELDNYCCKECGRSREEAILQVHHKRYISGRMPWEYALDDCETLCKGCHAAKHGKIMPRIGWEFLCQDDLGDLDGTCENCGANIRHTFLIYHKNWGTIEVGTFCCDKLTDSNIASNLIESETSYKARKARFLKSVRWKDNESRISIKQSSFEVTIEQNNDSYSITIEELKSAKKYNTLDEAKSKVFDVISSGELIEYFKTHNISYGKAKTDTTYKS